MKEGERMYFPERFLSALTSIEYTNSALQAVGHPSMDILSRNRSEGNILLQYVWRLEAVSLSFAVLANAPAMAAVTVPC